MQLRIQSIHFDAAAHLDEYIEKKVQKLDTYFDHITSAEVFLKLGNASDHGNKVVEIKLNVPHETLVATEAAESFEAATDLCLDKIKQQLVRYKDRLRSH